MGFLFSCCHPSTDDDHEPLLSRSPPIHEEPYPPHSLIDKAADVAAALHVGKLPSQSQLNTALRKVLRSNVLIAANGRSARVLGQQQQYRPLSDRGKKFLKDTRELIEGVIQFGLEKNDDDMIQDLIYQNIQIGKKPVLVDLDTVKDEVAVEEMNILANVIPSFEELDDDAHRLSDALFTVTRILVTSSSFRFLLADVLLISRALLADAAADIGQVSHVIEGKAHAVEHALRPKDKDTESDVLDEAAEQVKDGIKSISENAKEKWESLGTETSDHLKESAVDTFQKIIAQLQQDPTYKSALHTLIYLLSKYVEKMNAAASAVSSSTSTTTVPTPTIATDNLERTLTDLRILMERLASGRSLAPLIMHLEHTLKDITTASSELQSELRHFFEDLKSGIERGLCEPGFATSREGHDLAQQLFERGQVLMQSTSLSSTDANKVLEEVDFFIDALASDRTTQRIIKALDSLSKDTADLFHTVVGVAANRQRELREELKTDLIGWVLPRVLNVLETVPMPRVELKSETLEVVVDALVLSATASFLPDHIFVQNYNEVRMEASAAVLENPNANGAGVQTATRTRIHIDGLRISAHHIGYYMQYKGLFGGLFSWEDNGVMSVDVGRQGAAGQGLSVDIELETSLADENSNQFYVFRINDVDVDISGLHVSISKSRHWIFNALFLQPLAGPVVKRLLRRVVASQIRTGLENINEKLSAVRSEVHRRVEFKLSTEGGPGMEDYWKAICSTICSQRVDEASDDSFAETDTRVTMKGVVHKTRTKRKPESMSPTSPTETLTAVGIGPQILPGKGGPEPEANSATDQAREALIEVEGVTMHAAERAKAVTGDAIGTAATTRESLENVSTRMEAREGFEVRKKGWKSRAFDF